MEKAVRDEIRKEFATVHSHSEDVRSMAQAVKFASLIAGEPSNNPLFKKEVEEIVEQAWVLRARHICQEHKPPKETFDELVEDYKEMPTLSTRTSSSMLGQMYSSPTPIAYIMSLLAGVDDSSSDSVWEPTPGNGALLINLPSKYRAMGFEIDPLRYEFVGQMHKNIKQRDWFVNPPIWQEFPPEGFNYMIGNPPFGKGDRTLTVKVNGSYGLQGIYRKDLYIMLQSLAFLSLTGKAAFLIGAPLARQIGDLAKVKTAYRAKEVVLAWRHILANYKVTHHVTIHGSLYSKQGASFPVDLLVVKGRGVTHGGLPGVTYIPQLISSWDDLAAIKPLEREYSDPV